MKSSIDAYYGFVLEEDVDSGHGLEKFNIIRIWKDIDSLEFYFNNYSLLDLVSIKNCR